MPDAGEFEAIVAEARRAAETVRDALPDDRPVVCAGVDVLAACDRSDRRRQVGQFAAVILRGRANVLLVAKGFPTAGEERYLRVPGAGDGLAAREFGAPLGTVAVLVCHDVNAYSPRGEATTGQQRRRDWRERLRREVRQVDPAVCLHLAHHLDTPRSFLQAYGAWAEETRVPLAGVSALDAGLSDIRVRELAIALLTPADFPTFDLWEGGRPL